MYASAITLGIAILLVSAPWSAASAGVVYSSQLEEFEYPASVQHYEFTSQQQQMQMAYMDLRPSEPNGFTVVAMHGKNFCAATWRDTAATLVAHGYRVLAPDQIGFCKSSKPNHYQYSFQQLARNTNSLLHSLHINNAIFVAHSTGGMIAIRYALMFPAETQGLMLVNPIGLEDWKAKGVPSRSIEQWYERELKTSAEAIRRYELDTYYAGQWRGEYDEWVNMLAGLNNGPGKELVAWNSAAIYDMIYTQPVFYELKDLKVPTTLFIGDKDNTAIGKDSAPPSVAAKLGRYHELGLSAARQIPGCKLIQFPTLGHAPMLQDPQKFHAALLAQLAALHLQLK